MAKKWTKEKSAESFKLIIERISNGESATAILMGKGIDRDKYPCYTVFTSWLVEDPSLNEQYAGACARRADVIFDEIITISDSQGKDVIIVDGKEVTNHNVINRNRLQIDSRKWILSKMQPKKYGDKLDLTSDGEALTTPQITITHNDKDIDLSS